MATVMVTVLKSTDEILRAADRLEPGLRAAMRKALDAMQSQVPDLEHLLSTGRVDDALRAVTKVPIPAAVKVAITEIGLEVAMNAAMPEIARWGVQFNSVNARAVRWAEANAAELIKGINTATRQSVNTAIRGGLSQGLHPRVISGEIRHLVGLTKLHGEAVDRLYRSSLADGVTETHANRIRDRKSRQLIRWRADNIARTETIKAANMGQQLTWEAAADDGLLPATVKKVWMATGDDRTCKICAVLDGKTISVTQEYKFDRQATKFVRSGSTFTVAGTKKVTNPPKPGPTPPAHPQCRCTVVLKL